MKIRFAPSSGVLWSYVSTITGLGSGLLLLPFILSYLPETDVALWFVFNTVVALFQIVEGGFQTTLARNFGYVHGGATELAKQGLIVQKEQRDMDVGLMSQLLWAARSICTYISLLAMVALLIAGSGYLYAIAPQGYPVYTALTAWVIFSLGYIINFKYGFVSYILQGQGRVAEAQQCIAAPRAIQLLLGAAVLISGYGLIGLGVASLIGNIGGRWIAWGYYKKYIPAAVQAALNDCEPGELIKTVSHNAYKTIIVAFGTFLIQRSNLLIASSFLGLSLTASYGMTTTIFGAINGIAVVILQAHLPRINILQASGQRDKLRQLYGKASLIAFAIYAVATIILITVGPMALVNLSRNTRLIDTYPLIFCGLFYFFELNNGISGAYLASTNRIPFVKAIVVSGVAIACLSTILCLTTDLGIWSLLLSQAIVQLAYNDWKWPAEAVKHLGGGYARILYEGGRCMIRGEPRE